MQGFNKYYPPDFDPEKHGSLNSYQGKARSSKSVLTLTFFLLSGKHALGDRARKLDKGILIVRFELPFNIWCGTCNNHIGMGVRYNAEKKKIGNYYSTPIYSFRCKCHLCDGWFEIQTDPKNTRYVVVSGARQKDEDWDPEENGGFAVHDTNPQAVPADPLSSLEKTAVAETKLKEVVAPRLSSLSGLSERYSADPYALSVRARKRFREVKKVEKAEKAADDAMRGRYGLPEDLDLVRETPETEHEAKESWSHQRAAWVLHERAKKRRIGTKPTISRAISSLSKGSGSKSDAAAALRDRLLLSTAQRSTSNPFLTPFPKVLR